MEEKQLVDRYLARDEAVIAETQRQYGAYCRTIAAAILPDPRDAEEILNDTWAAAWNAIPPHEPQALSAFLGKITRRLALNRRRAQTTRKRGGGEVELTLEELAECLPAAGAGPEQITQARELAALLDRFLSGLSDEQRRVFLCRYWYFDPIEQIADRFGFSQSKVKMSLKRTREKLRGFFEREGITP